MLFYYISPQIWAWKRKRRFKMARYLDGLAAIFPFELESYRDTDLQVRFTGHPFVAAEHRPTLSYDPNGPVLLTPGSRLQPVRRIFPRMVDGFLAFAGRATEECAVTPYPSGAIRAELEAILEQKGAAGRVRLVPVSQNLGVRAVLTSSGTMSLSCALAGLPGAICYVAHPLTYRIGRVLVKVPYLGIANLLRPDQPLYPEWIQHEASPERLAAELHRSMRPEEVQKAAEAALALREILSAPAEAEAADWLLELIGAER